MSRQQSPSLQWFAIICPLMALDAGTQLGPYEIQAPLGSGGMGEVYRARDTRLDRTVAIKVLPSHLSSDLKAGQRFDREARTISLLNHPNICTLYDVGHQNGVGFLVMEFLDGHTLGHRLMAGPLPFQEALLVALEICEGLERAHRCGIVHRDLKPGNIMLTKSGVKLMDFGLAKAVRVRTPTGQTETVSCPPPDLPLTGEKVVVGTFQYMSPEQVEGKDADARSDIFALGTVLYEMVTGVRAFHGNTTTAVMAAVLEREPEPMTARNPLCPAPFARAVKLCLAKDPDERWQTVHDLKLEVLGIQQDLGSAEAIRPIQPRSHSAKLWSAVAALIVAAAGLAYFAGRDSSGGQGTAPTIRAQLLPPKGFTFNPYMYALSPDGKKIAFVATSDQKPNGLLFVQSLDSIAATPLPGIEDVAESGYPFWSPDSKEVGFFSDGKLKRVDANGGVPITLADAANAHGGAWSKDGKIVFSGSDTSIAFQSDRYKEGVPELLYSVPVSGGYPERITIASDKHLRDSHRWPSFMPDGRRILLTCSSIEETRGVGVSTIRTQNGPCIVDSRSPAQPTWDAEARFANLFVGIDNNLIAFSEKTPLSEGKIIAAKVAHEPNLGIDSLSVSPAGILAYMPAEEQVSQLVWYNRKGKASGETGAPGPFDGAAISADEQRVATSLSDSKGGRCIWIKNVVRGTLQRFTHRCAEDRSPVWSRDGSKVAYRSLNAPFEISVSGLGKEEPMFLFPPDPRATNVPVDFSPDGKLLIYANVTEKGSRLLVHSFVDWKNDQQVGGSVSPTSGANFSSDGRWLAFVSEENGEPEVYVVPFPIRGSKTQVSTTGGQQPRWRRDGRELFYIAPDGRMMAVSVDAKGDALKVGNPQTLFQTQITSIAHNFYQYDVTADGQRFVINTRSEQAARPITLLVNWKAELER